MRKTNIVPIKPAPPRVLLDSRELAGALGYSQWFVNKLARQGLIPFLAHRNGAAVHRRFDLDEVRAALQHEVR